MEKNETSQLHQILIFNQTLLYRQSKFDERNGVKIEFTVMIHLNSGVHIYTVCFI